MDLSRRAMAAGLTSAALIGSVTATQSSADAHGIDGEFKAYLRQQGVVFDPSSFTLREIERGMQVGFVGDPGGGEDQARQIAAEAAEWFFQGEY